ncbi:MAG: hypothetical protein IPP35_12575 [Elusimicrobia bacterium]|nr:hypothetical protein [Elusimicrobiota bacterium]
MTALADDQNIFFHNPTPEQVRRTGSLMLVADISATVGKVPSDLAAFIGDEDSLKNFDTLTPG